VDKGLLPPERCASSAPLPFVCFEKETVTNWTAVYILHIY